MGWFRSSTPSEDPGAPTMEERLAGVGPGVPGRCPSCDGLGYIDDLDIGRRYQIQHCKDCGHRWEYLFDADGRVVGLTELDEAGQPVARMRVRRRPAGADPAEPAVVDAAPPAPPAPTPEPADVAAAMIDVGGDDHVIDLRTAEPAADDPSAAPERMSPAEWLRHAVRR